MTDALVMLWELVRDSWSTNTGGLIVVFGMVAWLAIKLRQCESKHAEVMTNNARLAAAYLQLATTVNVLNGHRVVEVTALEDILAGRDAVKYISKPELGRRRSATNHAGGGAPDVSG